MAFTLGFWYPISGESLTVQLYGPTSGAVANTGGDALSEPSAGTRPGYYHASIAEALAGAYVVRVLNGSSVVYLGTIVCASDDGTYLVDDVRQYHVASQIVPWADVILVDTEGSEADVRVWIHDGYFKQIAVDSLDANATAELSVREYSAGSAVELFNLAFADTDIVNGCFEKSQASPGFAANKLYIGLVTVTIDSVAHVNRVPIPVGP